MPIFPSLTPPEPTEPAVKATVGGLEFVVVESPRIYFVVQYQIPDGRWWHCDRDIEMDTEAEAVERMEFLRPNYKGALRVLKIIEAQEVVTP